MLLDQTLNCFCIGVFIWSYSPLTIIFLVWVITLLSFDLGFPYSKHKYILHSRNVENKKHTSCPLIFRVISPLMNFSFAYHNSVIFWPLLFIFDTFIHHTELECYNEKICPSPFYFQSYCPLMIFLFFAITKSFFYLCSSYLKHIYIFNSRSVLINKHISPLLILSYSSLMNFSFAYHNSVIFWPLLFIFDTVALLAPSSERDAPVYLRSVGGFADKFTYSTVATFCGSPRPCIVKTE